VGGPQAGPKIAAIRSVVESCRRLKLPVHGYLAAVLPGFVDLPIQRLQGLVVPQFEISLNHKNICRVM
jgi:transposase